MSIHCNPVIKIANEHWSSFQDAKDENNPEVSNIAKSLVVKTQSESFASILQQVIGSMMIILSYLI